MPTGQPDLHISTVTLSAQLTLNCVKLVIKDNWHNLKAKLKRAQVAC